MAAPACPNSPPGQEDGPPEGTEALVVGQPNVTGLIACDTRICMMELISL